MWIRMKLNVLKGKLITICLLNDVNVNFVSFFNSSCQPTAVHFHHPETINDFNHLIFEHKVMKCFSIAQLPRSHIMAFFCARDLVWHNLWWSLVFCHPYSSVFVPNSFGRMVRLWIALCQLLIITYYKSSATHMISVTRPAIPYCRKIMSYPLKIQHYNKDSIIILWLPRWHVGKSLSVIC